MKFIITIIFLFPAFCFSQAADRSDTLPPIKTIDKVCYKASMKGNEIVLGEREWYKWFLDDEFIVKQKEGGYKSITRFDEDGEVDRISAFDDGANGELSQISTLEVEDEDTILKRFTKYYYDQKDFCYLDSSFNGDGSLALITTSVKDYEKKIELSKTHYPDGRFLSCYVDFYDEQDRIIRSQDRTEDNQIERETFFIRDTINHTSEYYAIENGDTVSHSMTHYNEKGLELYDTHFTKNYSDGEHQYAFDYRYNEYGDWIKKLVLREGELVYCVVRKITYYKN